MKASVFTLGCKVNEVESASIMSTLESMGWDVTDRLEPADVYILNTCAVTKAAEGKSRQLVARARRFNPSAPVYVCGCASEKDPGAYASRGAAGVFGAMKKEETVSAVCSAFGCAYGGGLLYPKQVRTRAFVKISDGCDSFCSYCVVPYLRGRVENRPVSSVVDEVMGCDSLEVVLTGINISAYDCGGGLPQLIDALSFTDRRIRLGSLECRVIDERLLSSLRGLKDFAPQFHLSLQSGSDRVLRAMNRHYTRAQYLEKCAMVYDAFPDAAITTDIIAGFPGETDDDFEESVSMIGEAGFARVHAFAFSPREGTAAYGMKEVPSSVKDARLHRLLEAGKAAEDAYVAGFAGRRLSVVWESFDGGYTCGYTGNYIRIYGPGERSGKQEVTVGGRFRDGAVAVDS